MFKSYMRKLFQDKTIQVKTNSRQEEFKTKRSLTQEQIKTRTNHEKNNPSKKVIQEMKYS